MENYKEAIQYAIQQVPNLLKFINSLKPFGITHFAYNKFISHHKMMALCPHIEWAYNDLGQAAFQEIVDLHTKNTFHPQNYSLWQVIKNNWVIEALKKRNVDHGISIYKYSDTECFEVFHFASTNNNESILNFYINNLQILEELIIHFKNFMHNALYDNSTSSDNYIHLDGTFDIYKVFCGRTPKSVRFELGYFPEVLF